MPSINSQEKDQRGHNPSVIDHSHPNLPGKPIQTVIVETHLGFAPPEQLLETITRIETPGINWHGIGDVVD